MGPLKDPNPRGAIWVYTYSPTPDIQQLELVGYPTSADFHPLGIDIVNDPQKRIQFLFVINHGRKRSTIEHFTLS